MHLILLAIVSIGCYYYYTRYGLQKEYSWFKKPLKKTMETNI